MIPTSDHMQVTTPAYDDPTCPSSSYAIGPIDPRHLVTWKALLSTGREITLLVPRLLPLSVLTDQAFKAGVEDGYFAWDLDDMIASQVVSEIYKMLYFAVEEEESASWCAQTVGFVVGELAWLAGIARTRARTGLAHLVFLLSFFPLDPLGFPSPSVRWQMRDRHHEAMRSYRADFRVKRLQGKSYQEAERLTLVASGHRTGGERVMLEHVEETPSLNTSQTFHLGQHVLEVQSVLLMDQEAGTETMQLDSGESYRLLVVLQSMFAQTSSM